MAIKRITFAPMWVQSLTKMGRSARRCFPQGATMLSLKVHTTHTAATAASTDGICVDFDTADGFETLPYQIISVITSELEAEDLIIVDKDGRTIDSINDLQDIQFKSGEPTDTEQLPANTNVAEVWVFSRSVCDFNKFCSSNVLDTQSFHGHAVDLPGCIQASYQVIDMPYQVCGRCRWFFDSSLIVEGSAAQAGGDHLQCFQCDISKLIDIGLAPADAATTLKRESESFLELNGSGLAVPIILYLRRQLLKQAHEQLKRSPGSNTRSREYQEFKARVESGARTVLVYEDPAQQEAARQHIDYAKVLEYALQHMGVTELPPACVAEATATAPYVPYSKEVQELEERALLVGLMRWFKVDFFKWCNKPACENPACNAPPGRMDGVSTVEPSPEERNIGGAGRTEVYKCRDCNQHTRFPRFNNPAHLMVSRRGRCGEFANAFCLICRALHLDAQYVLDFTDHVWCEVWLPSVQRFVHCDPCERAQDTPLMYEQGWNKKLTHVLSFSRYGVSDSIARYSRKQNTVLTKRCVEVTSERFVAEIVAAKDKEMEIAYAMRRASLPPVPTSNGRNSSGELPWDVEGETGSSDSRLVATCLRTLSDGRAGVQALCGLDVSWAQVQQRKRLQQRELQALQLSTDTTNSTFSKQGRISGDLEWKLSRGETGEAGGATNTPATSGPMAVALCSTDGPAVTVPPIAAPGWLRQVQDGQRVLFAPDSRASTDVLFATYKNPSFPCGDGQVCAPPAECYPWGGGLFPAVANCGETLVALGTTGKTVVVGTERVDGSVHVQHNEGALTDSTANEVSITRNGVLASNPTPQYIALTHTNSSSYENTATLSCISDYVCSVPSSIVFPTDNKSAEHMARVAQATLLLEKDLLGFSVIFAGNDPAGEVSHVLFFGVSGYPLVAFNGSTTYVKSVEPSRDHLPSTEQTARRSYHHLGGARHNDTAAFDSAAFLQSLLSADPSAHASLRLSRITVWAGESLVNGLQCTFEFQSNGQTICVSSPKCSSDNDSPVAQTLELATGDRVVCVQSRSGALIDSVEITTLQGKVLRAGGGGGNNLVKIDIAEGQMLCGFFGGTGGHLHHMGVVLMDTNNMAAAGVATDTNTPIAASMPVSNTFPRILSLCEELRMSECGMLRYYESHYGASMSRQSNIVHLAVLVARILDGNSPEVAVACLRTIATYINNILKDPTERKYQTIKLTNPVLQQSVLQARGGIELLLFGPAAFHLTLSALSTSLGQQVVQSAIASEILQSDKSAAFRALYSSWLRQYVVFFNAVMASLA